MTENHCLFQQNRQHLLPPPYLFRQTQMKIPDICWRGEWESQANMCRQRKRVSLPGKSCYVWRIWDLMPKAFNSAVAQTIFSQEQIWYLAVVFAKCRATVGATIVPGMGSSYLGLDIRLAHQWSTVILMILTHCGAKLQRQAQWYIVKRWQFFAWLDNLPVVTKTTWRCSLLLSGRCCFDEHWWLMATSNESNG